MKPLFIRTSSNSSHKNSLVERWDIEGLVKELRLKKLPETMVLNGFEKIGNLIKFIKSHIEIARHNNGKSAFKPYYDRLVKVNELLN